MSDRTMCSFNTNFNVLTKDHNKHKTQCTYILALRNIFVNTPLPSVTNRNTNDNPLPPPKCVT